MSEQLKKAIVNTANRLLFLLEQSEDEAFVMYVLHCVINNEEVYEDGE